MFIKRIICLCLLGMSGGESGYLEPDELYGFKMLEAVRDALLENNEFPIYPNFEK